MATSLQTFRPFDMQSRDLLGPRDPTAVWSDMAPECMEILNSFDIGQKTNVVTTHNMAPAANDAADVWSAEIRSTGTHSTPLGVTQSLPNPVQFDQATKQAPSPDAVHYGQSIKQEPLESLPIDSDGVEIAILALKNKTQGTSDILKPPTTTTRTPKAKRAVKKLTGADGYVSPKDVSPPPRNVQNEAGRKGRASPGASKPAKMLDPETLADKRARNKIAAEKCRRKRLAKVANTEAENIELKSRVEVMECQLRKIKENMRQVIAETEGGKRNHDGVPAMLMNILMEL